MSRLARATLAAFLALPVSARAQAPSNTYYSPSGSKSGFTPWTGATTTNPGSTTPVGTPQYGLAIATAQSLTVPSGAALAKITVEGNTVRCREDGTAPTASVGTPYPVGTVLYVWGNTLAPLQCIQTAATATLDVEYFR